MQELNSWDSFYVIVGSAAGALIGLQFVVMTLIAERPPLRAAEAGAAFATPTVIHFCTVLLLSAILRAPWQSPGLPAVIWGIVGLAGCIYAAIVTLRLRTQNVYKPVFEDWLFHAYLPLAAHVILIGSAIAAGSRMTEALFFVGGSSLILLFIGIHNSWDAVAYHVLVSRPSAKKEEEKGSET